MFGLEGQNRCVRRIEVFVKIQKKYWGVGGSGVGWVGSGWMGQGVCERRIEVFGEIHKQVAQRATIAHLTAGIFKWFSSK